MVEYQGWHQVSLTIAIILVLIISFAGNWVKIKSKNWLLDRLPRDGDHQAVQSAHSAPTPRIGGLAIVIAAAVGIAATTEPGSVRLSVSLLLSTLPVLLAGLAEDFGLGVSPKGRLIAAAVSGVVIIALQKFWITSIGFAGFDRVFLLAPLAIFLTLVWTAGLCHAFNLIDGLNGLAGFSAVLTSGGLAAIAWLAGDAQMAAFALVMMAAVSGFLIHNWPRGRIFLGDGGAYSIGHLLAWMGLALLYRNPDVAGISVALLYFWPVADTSWAIYRRWKGGRRTDQPDRMHFHQVAMRTLEIRFGLRGRRHISNSLASALMAPFIAIPIAAGVVFYQAPLMSLLSLLAMAAGFIGLYLRVYGFASTRPAGSVPSEDAGRNGAAKIPAE